MPIYEYRRQNGTTFEVVQRMSDDALTVDPETGKPVERVFHAPAIHFKGKGFHNTDYGTRNRNRETESAAKDGADKTAAKAAEKKADKKASDGGSSSGASSSSSGSGDSGKKSSGEAKKPAAKKD
jgi:putative FmdB family regulatory protein